MILIIIFVLICFVIFYFIFESRISDMYDKMREQEKTNKGMSMEYNREKATESDDRVLRLIKDTSTNMTELGMAISPYDNIRDIEKRHVGVMRDLIPKFKVMTYSLISETKGIDPEPLLDDSLADRDEIRKLISHWRYYTVIYDHIFITECQENTQREEWRECNTEWKAYYKDLPLSDLRLNQVEIVKELERALANPDQRGDIFSRITKKIISMNL